MTITSMFKNRRTKALEDLAFRMGYDFRLKDKYDIFRLLKDFELCREKVLKRARNIISREDQWQEEKINIFDYTYVDLSTPNILKERTGSTQTVFFVNSKHLSLPEFIIKPGSVAKENLNPAVEAPLRFEKYPAFERQYVVKGADTGFIKKSINKFLIQFLIIQDGWTIEGINFLLVIYKDRKLMAPAKMEEFNELCMEIYHRLKVPLK